jgi:hypothetical protein
MASQISQAALYHSVIFNDGKVTRNTWTDWYLIPSSRPVIVQPTPIYKYVEIPGRNGSLDLTDYLVGEPTYSDRKGSLEFIVVNNVGNYLDYGKKNNPKKPNDKSTFPHKAAESLGNWVARKDVIADFLNGRKMKVTLEDDPEYYYYGRVFFKEWRADAQFSRVVIEYQLEPYKRYRDGKEAGL